LIWRRVDLHLHTPASADYQEPGVTPIDILRKAESRGLDVIAFTDHNSVRGYADLWREIEDLELLEHLGRLIPAEAERLTEYRRLLDRILLLPGFEFTATFGFHILAIFPEGTSVRLMEHLLMLLGVPEERFGSGEVGATTDVLRAYEILNDHGALVIGAHVNSAHGVAMQGLRFGGQTKIAYTQDPHLHALEVTDLMVGGNRRSTARFFNGTKPEYPRRMHCIQGSDAHRLERDPQRESNLGVGDRATEVLLPGISFAELKAVFQGDDFTRTRPYLPLDDPINILKTARAEGNTATQVFHESLSTKRTGASHVLRDVVALANSGGGAIFLGASPFEKRAVAGIPEPKQASDFLQSEIGQQITPSLAVTIETLRVLQKDVLVVHVPDGAEKPYALAPGGIFVRHGAESTAAHRDQIVAMVRGAAQVAAIPPAPSPTPPPSTPDVRRNGRGSQVPRRDEGPKERAISTAPPASTTPPVEPAVSATRDDRMEETSEDAPVDEIAPRTGVEVVTSYEQDGMTYYTLHDLRHRKLVHNVTRDTERRLWRYAIEQREAHPLEPGHVRWNGDLGFWKSYKPRGGEQKYNLVYRGDGDLRVFYGVSADGMDDRWRAVLPVQRTPARTGE
jgi:hypothetical protein